MVKFFKKVSTKCRECFSNLLGAIDSQEDSDRLLSYYTRQQVLFIDKNLGATFYFIQVCILSFVIGYILIFKQGYLQWEQALGAVVTHVSGDAVAVSTGAAATRYFSIEELTYPGLENGNLFVATRQEVHRQMRGFCEDPGMPCVTDGDCTVQGKGTCTEMGLCLEHSWCNMESEAEKYEIDSTRVQIWVRSFIQYVKLAPEKLFSTESRPTQDNTFTLRQLLKKAEPIPVNYEEVAELGAAFEVGFRWDCSVGGGSNNCEPDIFVRRLDSILDPDNIGFGFKYAEYIDDAHRVQNEVRGLRLFFRTSGVGRKVSVAATIMTVSTSMPLLQFALVFADLLLTKVFANRKKYIARKYEKSPDMGDYIEQLELKKAEASEESDIDKAEMDVVKKEQDWLMKFQEAM